MKKELRSVQWYALSKIRCGGYLVKNLDFVAIMNTIFKAMSIIEWIVQLLFL